MKERQNNQPKIPGLENLYCSYCGRFLAKVKITVGYLGIKCKRCKSWSTIDAFNLDEFVELIKKLNPEEKFFLLDKLKNVVYNYTDRSVK